MTRQDLVLDFTGPSIDLLHQDLILSFEPPEMGVITQKLMIEVNPRNRQRPAKFRNFPMTDYMITNSAAILGGAEDVSVAGRFNLL